MEHLVRGFNGRIECPWAGVLENSRVQARNEMPICRRTAASVPMHALLTPSLSHSLGPSIDLAQTTAEGKS